MPPGERLPAPTGLHPALESALIVGAWVGVILLITIGLWFLRQRRLLHTAVVITLILVGVFLAIRLRELLIMLVAAMVLAFILGGPVDRVTGRRVKRPMAVGIVYLSVAAILVLIVALIVPRLIVQARNFVADAPDYTDRIKAITDRLTGIYGGAPEQVQGAVNSALDQAQAWFRSFAGGLERGLLDALSWTVKSVLIFVMSIYLLLDRDRLRDQYVHLFPLDMKPDAETALAEVATTFRSYLRGQGTVILFVAVTVSIVLFCFGIPYALLIGTLAGILEVIPYFGALAGAIPAVTLGFMKSPAHGIGLIAAFIAINQIEGHLVIPFVMGRELEMRPFGVLLALIAGEMLFGVVGMIIAVPLVSLIRVLIPHVAKHYHLFRMRERLRRPDGAPEPPPPVAVTDAAAT